MMPFRKSLVFRIFVISFILLALPLLVDSFVIVQSRYNENIKNSKEVLIKSPESRIFILSRVLQIRRQAMTFAQYFLGIKDKFPEGPSEELNKKIKDLDEAGNFEDALLLKIGKDGGLDVIASSFENDDQYGFRSYRFYECMTESEYQKGSFSLVFDYPASKHHLLFGDVIRDENGTPVGVLLVLMDITSRLQDMLSVTHGNLDLHHALLIRNMTVVVADDPSFQFQHLFPLSDDQVKNTKIVHPFSADLLQKEPLKVSYELGHPFLVFEWKGKKYVGVVNPIQDTNFFLLTYTLLEQFYLNPFFSFFDIYLIFGVILLGGGYLAFLSSRRISKPFKKLSEVMESIQKGELSVRYAPDPLGFEINSLGIAFNEMIDTLLEKKFLAEEEKVRTELYEKELLIGQQVQRGLLPSEMPTLHDVEIAERYLPAKEVGGDFYDVFTRKSDEDEQIALVVADASGKGVQACFYSLGVRSDLRVFAREFHDAGLVMQHVNRLFYHDSGDTGMFVTLLLGIYDPKRGELTYCSCGHNPPYIRRKDGSLEVLGGVEMALGVKKELELKSRSAHLEKGDLLVFYTDGVTEAHNESNELFSEARLEAFLREKGGVSAEEVASGLIDEVKKFQGKAMQHDDITLLVMKLL